MFRKVSKNTAEILEKYFKNFENYCEEFKELFHKILTLGGHPCLFTENLKTANGETG